MILAVAMGLLPWASAVGQGKRTQKHTSVSVPDVEESAGVLHLLRTADDAVDRGDWKLAIDSLQRVIEEPEGLLRMKDDNDQTYYVSPRVEATRRLASLPDAGRDAYHVLYEGRARKQLEEARQAFDLAALRRVTERFADTPSGQAAGPLLAGWLLDMGRPIEALRLIADYETYNESRGGLTVQMKLLRAVGLTLLGDRPGAAAALDSARSSGEPSGPHESLTKIVASFLESGKPWSRTEPLPLQHWPAPAGGGDCTGRMDPVTPSFASHLPWRRKIPSVIPGTWPDLDELRPSMLPVFQPIAAQGRLFVKAGLEPLALDIQSFAVLWTGQTEAVGIMERAERKASSGVFGERGLLMDFVANSMSTSHGLVFSLERGEPRPSFERDGVVIIPRAQRGRNDDDEQAYRIWIAALDERSGALRWHRGTRNDPDEMLTRAQFLAPPIAVGDVLWIPFEASGDLYVGILDPADGNLIRSILLCTMGGFDVDPAEALFPALADDTVYIPTGHGLLFAVSAGDYSITWVAQYPSFATPLTTNQRAYITTKEPRSWFSGPPVVSGRWVLLAPTDTDQLIAFDRVTGRQGWQQHRASHRYIVAADPEVVWLGGETVSAFDLSDGSLRWSTSVNRTTGRAVLCGNSLFIPTMDGLTELAADSGEPVRLEPLPSDHAPLGNLLCMAGSLISVDPNEVRAFPDRNSYQAALAANQTDPQDARAAIRLAFLELLEHRPQQALDALQRAQPGDSSDVESQAAHLAHLRVQSWMQLAAHRDTPFDQAVAYLQDAVESAQAVGDQVAVRMALGNVLRRAGRFIEAYRTLWRLAQESISDEIIDSNYVRRPARLVIADALARIETELAPSEIDDVRVEASKRINQALAKLNPRETRQDGISELRRLAEAGTVGGLNQAAYVALARWELDHGKYERADQFLTESLSRAGDVEQTAATHLARVDGFLEPTPPLTLSAKSAMEILRTQFAGVRVDGNTVESHIADRLNKIDDRVAERHAAALHVPEFVTADRAMPFGIDQDQQQVRMIQFRGPRNESLAERIILIHPPQTLRSYNVRLGQLEWESELLTHDDFEITRDQQQEAARIVHMDRYRAVLDGQVMLIHGPHALHAVGTLSGRRLWAIPIRSAMLLRDGMLRQRTLDAGSGRVAAILQPGVLAVRRVVDGSLIWERDIGFEPVAIRIRDDYVLAAESSLERIVVYHLNSGEIMSEISFSQPPDAGASVVPVSYSNGIIAGPFDHAVAGCDVRTGVQRWSVEIPGLTTSLFELEEGRFLVSGGDGLHRILDATTGDVVFEAHVDGLKSGAVYGTLEDSRLILAGFVEDDRGEAWTISAVDLETGRTQWTKTMLGTMHQSHLDLAEGVIPFVAESGRSSSGNRGRSQSVLLLDKRTGETVGTPLDWDGVDRGDAATGDLSVWPGRLVLQTIKGIVSYETRTPQDGLD